MQRVRFTVDNNHLNPIHRSCKLSHRSNGFATLILQECKDFQHSKKTQIQKMYDNRDLKIEKDSKLFDIIIQAIKFNSKTVCKFFIESWEIDLAETPLEPNLIPIIKNKMSPNLDRFDDKDVLDAWKTFFFNLNNQDVFQQANPSEVYNQIINYFKMHLSYEGDNVNHTDLRTYLYMKAKDRKEYFSDFNSSICSTPTSETILPTSPTSPNSPTTSPISETVLPISPTSPNSPTTSPISETVLPISPNLNFNSPTLVTSKLTQNEKCISLLPKDDDVISDDAISDDLEAANSSDSNSPMLSKRNTPKQEFDSDSEESNESDSKSRRQNDITNFSKKLVLLSIIPVVLIYYFIFFNRQS